MHEGEVPFEDLGLANTLDLIANQWMGRTRLELQEGDLSCVEEPEDAGQAS